MTDTNENEDQLPAAVIAELRRRDQAPAVITSRVDHALSGMARAHFSSRKVQRWRQPVWAAAAACVLLVGLFTTNLLDDEVGTSIHADVDGSGTVDIADVLALARAGQAVDQETLDAFAFRLVSLDGNDAP